MNVVGMIRAKNEARWIRRCIESILPLCSRVYLLDDRSTDRTVEEAAALGNAVIVKPTPFMGLDEVRDKNFLLDMAMSSRPDWVISIDGDEVLSGDHADLLTAMSDLHGSGACLSLPIVYLWDSENQMRVDGVYGKFRRESVFQPSPKHRFVGTGFGGNFHCGNVPQTQRNSRGYVETPLMHFGYMYREDRIRKWEWYNVQDPMNHMEDYYQHVVQGDIPAVPADAKLKHAGPLELKKI